MEVWIQYTLDLMDPDKPEGTLTLGGWGTDEICYKFVPEKQYKHAGWQRGQEFADVGPEKTFPARIQAASWKVKKCVCGRKTIDRIYSDDFMYVYKVTEMGDGKYNISRGDWEKVGPIVLGLVIFIRTSPIHSPAAFKTFLQERMKNPQVEPEPDPEFGAGLEQSDGIPF